MKRHLLIASLAGLVGCGGGGSNTGSGGTTGNPGTAGDAAGQAGTTGGAGTTGSAGTGGYAGTTGAAGTTGVAGNTGGSGTTGRGGTTGPGTGGSAAGTTGSAGRGGTTGSAGTTGGAGTTGTGGTGTTNTNQSVLERNKNPSRDGHFIQPTITKTAAAAMMADTAFNTAATFSGNVQGSPLFLDGTSGGIFVVGTVNNDVIARKENGSMAWTRNIGAPATGNVGCPSFRTTAPLGIASTPVIDGATRTIFAAGSIGTASGVTGHIVSAINADDGTVKSGWPVNVSDVLNFDETIANQRSALSFVGGKLYVPYGGYVGDCGAYHGRVVIIDPAAPGTAPKQWATGGQGEGIWAPGGMASDGNGIIVSTGNRTPATASGAHQDSEQVTRVNAMGMKTDYFYPSTWQDMDGSDADLGSVNPIVMTVPGATPSNIVVAIAKDGKGYILDAAQLRGTSSADGGQKSDFTLASAGMSIHSVPAAYRTAMGSYVVVSTTSGSTGCPSGSGGSGGRRVMAVKISAASPPKATIAWCAEMATVTTGPIATTTDGSSDAIVWYTSNGQLRGVDGDTGAVIYNSGTSSCAGVQRWTSPIAVKGRIIAAGMGRLCAWGVAGSTVASAEQPKAAKQKRKLSTARR